MPDSPNQHDSNGDCLETGNNAENLYRDICVAEGWQLRHSSREQDMFEHWDWLQYAPGSVLGSRVEVKGMKKICRSDVSSQDELLWIELHGVNKTNDGWLYGGKADLIAFELKDVFVIVQRKELILLVESLITDTVIESPQDALYCIYQRKERCDRLTLIKTSDLKLINYMVLWKHKNLIPH